MKKKLTSTQSAPPDRWRIEDSVTGLRQWGTDRVHLLPTSPKPGQELVVGSLPSPDTWLQLKERTVSRQHAKLIYRDEGWLIEDTGSKNGLWVDGDEVRTHELSPGTVIGLGDCQLVVESARFAKFHRVVRRLYGWEVETSVIDQAATDIRDSTRQHRPLVLHATSGLNAISELLHVQVKGADQPFVLCERRGERPPARSRHPRREQPRTFYRGMDAFSAAYGGTMVAWLGRLPDDWEQVLNARRSVSARVWLIVGSRSEKASTGIPLVIPPLETRMHEIGRIIDEYGADAVEELGGEFTHEDRVWIEQQALSWVKRQALTYTKIGGATRFAVAYRLEAKAARARGESRVTQRAIAKRLGAAASTVSEWWRRRNPLPAWPAGIAGAVQASK